MGEVALGRGLSFLLRKLGKNWYVQGTELANDNVNIGAVVSGTYQFAYRLAIYVYRSAVVCLKGGSVKITHIYTYQVYVN